MGDWSAAGACDNNSINLTKARVKNRGVQPWQTCTRKECWPYSKYKILYGERKFAREFATQKQNLSFTEDLPPEIRLAIYGYLFDTPGRYFELWAPQDIAQGMYAIPNLFPEYAHKTKILRIMRVSKKIHQEVAEYFYGQHNFRFNNYNGFQMMNAFNYTIRAVNCNFIKHITVQIPNRDGSDKCLWSKTKWEKFQDIQTSRGLRIPDSGFRAFPRRSQPDVTIGDLRYDKAVRKVFLQLSTMPSLRRLEIVVPWNYRLIKRSNSRTAPCDCPAEDVQSLSPEDQVRHHIEGHSFDGQYWALLASLKQTTASGDLSIALVIDFWRDCGIHPDAYYNRRHMRQGRWLAAYASVMGYQFGCIVHMRPDDATREVRYDMHELLSVQLVPEAEQKPQLEPPALTV
ncbi:hypothetical protein Daus18300_011701 [Diaporthe australafricana]|uniref:F-box domain-containing protein n=1 Tax=Diaporthe australafricana TaxID=127596 RepID=A0ABR3W5P6_9PEZI